MEKCILKKDSSLISQGEKIKALVLMSGGLDSTLAVKVLMEQGIDVTGISFVSNFFKADEAKKSAERLGINLIEHNFSKEYLKILKNPKHGYGKNMNPCIDCHGFMIKTAFGIMKERGFDFVATGEVVGQRRKSQNKNALGIVEKYGEVDGHLLRPLSAKILPETRMEKEGLVDREKLLGIEGRNRKTQMDLAKKYGISDYPSPAGGCILTYSEYSHKLRKMVERWSDCDSNDIDLLQAGRPFWYKDILLLVGRDKEDSEKINKLARNGDIILESAEKKGPVVLLRDKTKGIFKKINELEIDIPEKLDLEEEISNKDDIIKMAAIMTGYFSNKLKGKKIKVKIENK